MLRYPERNLSIIVIKSINPGEKDGSITHTLGVLKSITDIDFIEHSGKFTDLFIEFELQSGEMDYVYVTFCEFIQDGNDGQYYLQNGTFELSSGDNEFKMGLFAKDWGDSSVIRSQRLAYYIVTCIAQYIHRYNTGTLKKFGTH